MHRYISYLTIFGLLCLPATGSTSSHLPLDSFEANYEMFYGDLKAAEAHLSLQRSGTNWRWQLTTKPTGLAAILTNKKPHSETIISFVEGSPRIQKVTISEGGKKDKLLEAANFDWNNRQVEMSRKGVSNTAVLSGVVYDYLSVHLLTAKMQQENLQQSSADFYYKGRLVKLNLKQLANSRVTIGASEIDTIVYEQSLEGSRTKSIYYYDPDRPITPMKIETKKPERKSTTMLYVPAN